MKGFKKGDRIRLSDEGAQALALGKSLKNRQRLGTVLSDQRRDWIAVRWDGQAQTTRDSYHEDFIERVES